MPISEVVRRALYERADGKCECKMKTCKHHTGRCGAMLRGPWEAHRIRAGGDYTRLLHKSWHVIVTRTPTFRVANASQNSPCSIRPCHDCRPIASVAYPHQR